ncbi:MAG TPA: cytochrome c biogenesis protein CcdA [Balneolaceae bacterium]|nr:cytochrome c biogenesis protein CcdA [Balneolaceae bacterium]
MRIKASFLGIALIVLSPFLLMAQLLDPVEYTITETPSEVKAGEVFEVVVKATIEGEWNLYSVLNDPDAGPYPTKFTSGRGDMAVAGAVTESPASIELDPNFNAELGWHSGEAFFTIPVAFHEELQGREQILLEVLYQVCDDRSCLPPKTKEIVADIDIVGVADQPFTDFSDSGATVEQAETFELTSSSDVSADSIWGFMWLAISAGLAALLTPCVFPLIPLVVSYFSNQGEGGRKTSWGNAFLFGLSIILIFTAIGALLALILGVAGVSKFASNPVVNLLIGILFIIFGVSLLGVFELRLPYKLTNWLNKKSNEGSGLTGTLFMGFTISAVSFSCTAPFVGAILAATTGGEWFYPILGMLGFSTAFASPFILFAMFPGYLESLPKSGSWMNVIKVILGFIILAASVKFISNADIVWDLGLISRPFGIALWITLFFLAGLFMLGVFSLYGEKKPDSISAGRVFLAMPFLLFSFYLMPGLMGSSLGIWDAWLPVRQPTDIGITTTVSGGGAGEAEGEWSQDYELSLTQASEKGVPLFIDFTGYTCTNCRAMESTVFIQPNIREKFALMEKVKLYTDGGTRADENQAFQFELTGTLALPTYVILNPETGQILDQLIGYTSAGDFEQFLERGLERYTL